MTGRRSRSSRSSFVLIARASSAAADRSPCFNAFRLDRALPSSVRGPVDRSHGLFRSMVSRSDASPSGLRR